MVDDNNEQQKYLTEFNEYFPESDRESGVIKEIREDLAKFKQITDVEERYEKFRPILREHREKYYRAEHCRINGNLEKSISKYDTIEKYDKYIIELNSLVEEVALASMRKARDQNNKTQCSNCQDTQNQLDQAKQEIQTLKEKLAELQPNNDIEVDNQIKSNQIKSNQIKSNQIKSNQIKSNQIKSNQIKSNQIKSNQIKSNQIKSNQINSWILLS